jgi:hypothetical protein
MIVINFLIVIIIFVINVIIIINDVIIINVNPIKVIIVIYSNYASYYNQLRYYKQYLVHYLLITLKCFYFKFHYKNAFMMNHFYYFSTTIRFHNKYAILNDFINFYHFKYIQKSFISFQNYYLYLY